MSIQPLFLQEIAGEHGLIEVVHASGGEFVLVYTGPFVLQIELVDLRSVMRALARTVHESIDVPGLRLHDGSTLSIGRGADTGHIWINAGEGHLRLSMDVANALIGALSEAHKHVTINVAHAQAQRATGGATC